MSVLETPRIYFCGQTSFDPVTTNNYPRNYDEMGAQTVITPDGSTQKFRDAAIADVTSTRNRTRISRMRHILLFYEPLR